MKKKKSKAVQKPKSRIVRIWGNELTEYKITYGNNFDSENVFCAHFDQAFNYAKFDSKIGRECSKAGQFISAIEDLGTATVILPTDIPK